MKRKIANRILAMRDFHREQYHRLKSGMCYEAGPRGERESADDSVKMKMSNGLAEDLEAIIIDSISDEDVKS